MTRHILALVTAAVLFCLLMTAPAHAQWAKGPVYTGVTFAPSVQPGSTAANSPAQTITVTSHGNEYYPGPYFTSGSASANVYQDCEYSTPTRGVASKDLHLIVVFPTIIC